MILLEKYTIEHWKQIDDAIEPFTPLIPPDNFVELTNRSIAVTGLENGVVMACGGVTYKNDDEGLVWVKVSKKCLREPYRWAKTILQAFRIIMDVVDLKVSTYVIKDFIKGDKLARIIGLERTDEYEEYNGNIYYKYTVT